eukprot:11040734-Alexandrium_andersonii.AAC.1
MSASRRSPCACACPPPNRPTSRRHLAGAPVRMRVAPGGTPLPAHGTLPSLRGRQAGRASPQHMGTVIPGA